jgi:hypothetical protein
MGMEGRELVFRPRGAGRFVQAAFLSIWLVAWAIGEAFALFLLGHGIWALWTGSPAMGQDGAPGLGRCPGGRQLPRRLVELVDTRWRDGHGGVAASGLGETSHTGVARSARADPPTGPLDHHAAACFAETFGGSTSRPIGLS